MILILIAQRDMKDNFNDFLLNVINCAERAYLSIKIDLLIHWMESDFELNQRGEPSIKNIQQFATIDKFSGIGIFVKSIACKLNYSRVKFHKKTFVNFTFMRAKIPDIYVEIKIYGRRCKKAREHEINITRIKTKRNENKFQYKNGRSSEP